jgi:hypothetical protein
VCFGAHADCLSRRGGTRLTGDLHSWRSGYGSHATSVRTVWLVAMLAGVTRGCEGGGVCVHPTQDGWAEGTVDELVDLEDFVVWGLR